MKPPKKSQKVHTCSPNSLMTCLTSRYRPNLTWLRFAWLRSTLIALTTLAVVVTLAHLGLYSATVIELRLEPSLELTGWDVTVDSSDPRTGSQDLFTSPLVVSKNDWPLTKHLVPISLKSSLGLSPPAGEESSATRPITVAYVRACENYEAGCFVEEPQNHSLACPYPGLKQTRDWNTADVVVMNVWRFMGENSLPHIKRPPGQIWVMLSTEAPYRSENHNQLDYPELKGQFNLTMSYRLDSDIPFPYGYLVRRDGPVDRDFDAVYKAKRFHAAWLVSHCSTVSRRERYVQRLQRNGLTTHVYGLCGNYSCVDGGVVQPGTGQSHDKVCMPRVSHDYFFYLAFENYLCKDYISEKLFKMFHNVDTIPVVRGGADYTRLFPPDTFVDTSRFATAKDLAKYLVRLANNKQRYMRMLRAKWAWSRLPRPSWFCALGESLARGVKAKVIPDLRKWYTTDQCRLPADVSLSAQAMLTF